MAAARANRAKRQHWLKSWRYDRRLSQAKLAEVLGYDVTYIAKIEGGTRPPSRQFLARLAQVSGAPEEALLHALSSDLARTPLPVAPDELIGRRRAVADLVALLTGASRLVTLVGPPGIGKTRLALEVASQLDRVVLSGSWWVSLADVTDPADVVHRINRELGVAVPPGDDPLDRLVDRLRGHQALLVLDNFEQVVDAKTVVSTLVSSVADLTVLVTSREALGLVSEQVWRVPTLAVPDHSRPLTIEEVGAASAVELFVARARMAEPRFALNEANSEAVVRTCADLDGIPLSIVLVAGSVPIEGVHGVAARAGQHLDLSEGAPSDLSPHQRTLHGAIAGSWRFLAPPEADFLARLSVFTGGFDAEAAWAAAGAPAGHDRPATTQMLSALVRKSLVEVRGDDDDVPRFELLACIRLFASEQLAASGALDETQAHHSRHFEALAQRCGAGLIGGEQTECVRRFGRELDNLTAAFGWARGRNPRGALRLAASTWRFFLMRDIPTGRRWLEEALAAAPDATADRGACLAAAGALAWVTGNFEESGRLLDEAVAVAAHLDLPDVAAIAWLNRGALAEQRRLYDDADESFGEALRLYTSLGDDRGRAQALVGRGMICRRRDDLDTACGHWLEAARLFRSVGDRFNHTMALGNLAWAAEHEGQLEEADEWRAECRAIQIALGDARGLATTTAGLARVALKRGALDEACSLTIEALHAYHHLGDRPWAAATLVSLADVLAQQGRPRDAVRLVGAADALWSEMHTAPQEEHRLRRDRVLVECGEHLTAGEVTRALGAGRTMTLGDAIEFGTRSGGGSRETFPATPSVAGRG